MTVKQTATPLQAKNAVSLAGIEAPEHVLDGPQPHALVLQRTLGTAAEGSEPVIAALQRQCEVHVSTGNQFVEQWKPQYSSDTLCFDILRGAGGLGFTNVARLRVPGAPEVTIATYTRGVPRRIERQTRASWILVCLAKSLFQETSIGVRGY